MMNLLYFRKIGFKMLIFVELPEADKTFQFDLEYFAMTAQLKSESEDETSFSHKRQNLYLIGILLDSSQGFTNSQT